MSRKGCIVVSILVLVVFLILCGCVFVCVWFSSAFSSLDTQAAGTVQSEILIDGGEDKIVVIDIEGMILDVESGGGLFTTSVASSQKITRYIDVAISDSKVKAIILNMDTPGGEVYASDAIYNKVLEAKQNGIKVITLMRSTAASGGYYIAAPSDKIVASKHTITGSIGVRADFQSLEGLYEKLGIETRTITNSEGDFKTGQGLFDDDMHGEEDQIYQEIVDEEFDRFVTIVSEGRGIEKEEVLKFADGRVFLGSEAKEVGLVDQLGDFDTALEVASSEAGITNPTVIGYSEYDLWSTLFGYVGMLARPEAKVVEALDVQPGIRLFYLYSE